MKRLNVKLALWLVGIAVFSVVGVHFLHGYQVDRNASSLKVQAETARSAGNKEEAVKLFSQYLRHRDDREAYQALAELTVEVAKDPNATQADFFKAYSVLEEAIRRYPDLDSVRMILIDYTLAMRRVADAQDHIRYLKEQGSKDTLIPLKEAACFMYTGEAQKARAELEKMVGYDAATKQFAAEAPATAKEVDAFVMLSSLLMGKDGDPALADGVMEKLVEWNPDSAKAHVARANFLSQSWQRARPDTPEGKDLQTRLFAEVQEELKKAMAIEPENADALLLSAGTAMVEQNFPAAQEILDRAVKLHPRRADVYLRRAMLAQVQKQTDKAADELKAGIKAADNTRPLLENLVELQFQMRDLDAASATCEQMSKVPGIPAETVAYQKARIQVGRGNFLEAARDLERVRPALERQGAAQMNAVNTLLGRCYAVLGMADRQLEVYRRILNDFPNLIEARIGEVGALQALGRFSEAEPSVTLLADTAQNAGPLQSEILQLVVAQELSKPVAERNWARTEVLTKLVEGSGQRTAAQNRLLEANLLLAQGKSDEALAILGALRKENPKEVGVWMLLCKLMGSDPKYTDRLPQLLTLAEKELGPIPPLVLEKIKVVSREGGEKASERLQKIEESIKEFEPRQQQAILGQLGAAYLAAGDYENGKRCLKEVMAAEPSNARIRQTLLELALDRRDDATADQIIEDLSKSPVFGQQSTLYRYALAARQLRQLVENRSEGKEKSATLSSEERTSLIEARKLVDEAISLRPEWAPLWRLRSDINQLEGDLNGAISDLQRSLAYSQSGQEVAARKLVTLLYATQRYTEANEAMKYLGDFELPEAMRRIAQDVKSKSGNSQEAIAMAREDIKKDPENASNYLFLGELLESNGEGAAAEVEFRTATEKAPKLARAWEFYVRRLKANEKPEEAAAAAEEARKNLPEEPLSIARLYQRIGNNELAEKFYLEALEKKPGDLFTLRHLAEFYAIANNLEKTQKSLEQLIEAASKSDDRNAQAYLSWARTQKAQSIASDRDYAGTMEAVKLVEQNAQNGELSRQDMQAVVSLLSSRLEEPESRKKAIGLLEKLRDQEPLSAQQAVALAQLHNREGDWPAAQTVMTDALTRFENSPEIAAIFAEMSFEHEQYDEARQYTDRAESLLQDTLAPPTSPAARGLRILKARLLVREGQQAEAAKVLESWLPRPLPQNQLPLLLDVAGQMEGLELYADAERLLKDYLSQSPDTGKVVMAGFLARRGEVEQSFALLDESRSKVPVLDIMTVGLTSLRNYPEKVTDAQRKQIESWANTPAGAADDPVKMQLARAEMYDLLGQYDEVEKIYREMLKDDKLPRVTRAIVQNNLAFVLAGSKPSPERGAESLKLIQEAINVLGPSSDLIDTRALAFLAQGKYDQAAADVRLAVGDRPTTSKYYHLAQIEKQLGNDQAAREAIAKAEELHPAHNPFTPFERQGYEQLKRELN